MSATPYHTTKKFSNIAAKAKATDDHIKTARSIQGKEGNAPAVAHLVEHGWDAEVANRHLNKKTYE